MLGLPHGSFTVFVEIHLVFGIGYLQSHVLGVGGGDEQGWSKTQSLAPRAYNLIGHISPFHRKKYFKKPVCSTVKCEPGESFMWQNVYRTGLGFWFLLYYELTMWP